MRLALSWVCGSAVLCAFGLATAPLRADWTESVQGDLSSDPALPTPIGLSEPATTITGRMGSDPISGDLDADFFTFTVPEGSELTAIDLTVYLPSLAVGGGAFFALGAGNSISPDDADEHLSNLLVNQPGPLLPLLATPTFGGPGVAGPLPSGQYTLWFQETVGVVDYQFVLRTTVIPEPATAMVLSLAVPLLAVRFRK